MSREPIPPAHVCEHRPTEPDIEEAIATTIGDESTRLSLTCSRCSRAFIFKEECERVTRIYKRWQEARVAEPLCMIHVIRRAIG